MVIVFQTIEIERLGSEIEILRVRCKENERKLFSVHNYDVQIRELTDKCINLEREREEYQEELTKLNAICSSLYTDNQNLQRRLKEVDVNLKHKLQTELARNSELNNEMERMKNRLVANEKSKARELEQLRTLMETQRKSMIDREMNEAAVRHRTEISSFENIIRKLKETNDNRQRELEEARDRNQRCDLQLNQLRTYADMFPSYEKKVNQLNQEVQRVADILAAREQEIHQLKKAEARLNQRVKEQQDWEIQMRQLRSTLDSKNKEIQDWRIRHNQFEAENARNKQQQIYADELSKKLVVATDELARVNSLLRVRNDELLSLKKSYSDREMQLSNFKNLENDLSSAETRLNNSRIENERLNGILKSRLAEIEDGKKKLNALEGRLSSVPTLEKERKTTEDRLASQIRSNEELQQQINKMRSDLDNARKIELAAKDLEREKQGLIRQLQRQNNTLRNCNQQIEQLRTKTTRMQTQIVGQKNADQIKRGLQERIGAMVAENGKINDLLRDRKREISLLEETVLKQTSQLAASKQYEPKILEAEAAINRLKEQIAAGQRNSEGLDSRLRDADNRAKDMESQAYKISQEKQRVAGQLRAKAAEYDDLRSKYSKLEAQTQKNSALQATIQNFQRDAYAMTSQNEQMMTRIKTLQSQLDRERQYVNEFGFKIIVLSSEIERQSRAQLTSGAKSKEYQELSQSFSRFQMKVKEKDSEIDSLLMKITGLENRLTTLTNQFNRILNACQASEEETSKIVAKMKQYQDYANRIQILSAEMDRLNIRYRELDEENKRIRLRYADQINLEKRQEILNGKIVLLAVEVQALRERAKLREKTEEEIKQSLLKDVARTSF